MDRYREQEGSDMSEPTMVFSIRDEKEQEMKKILHFQILFLQILLL